MNAISNPRRTHPTLTLLLGSFLALTTLSVSQTGRAASRRFNTKRAIESTIKGGCMLAGGAIGGVGGALGGAAIGTLGGLANTVSLNGSVTRTSKTERPDESNPSKTVHDEVTVVQKRVPGLVKTLIWGAAGAAATAVTGVGPEHWPVLHSLGALVVEHSATATPLVHAFVAGAAVRASWNVAKEAVPVALVSGTAGGVAGAGAGYVFADATLR